MVRSIVCIVTQVTDHLFTDAAPTGKQGLMDRVKRFLKVDTDDNDDTEELHNKYRETSKDRKAKIKLFEEQLNIKVLHILLGYYQDPNNKLP